MLNGLLFKFEKEIVMKKRVIIILLVSMVSIVFAGDKLRTKRDFLMKIKEQKETIAELENRVSKLKSQIESWRTSYIKLQLFCSENNLEVPSELKVKIDGKDNLEFRNEFELYSIGYVPNIRIDRIINENSAICHVSYFHGNNTDSLVKKYMLIKGVDTTNWITDKNYTIKQDFIITGTYEVKKNNGNMDTLFVIEPIE
jgi:hypothetical protein